uniref:RNA-binding protein EWS n=2 Tax=Canis lupus familiaris TaxID=9615 RepID=A0A8C0Q6C7_CANLF
VASMDHSTYSQAADQQGYSAYTAQPTQGYAQTTQAYGQQSYGTYGQPTGVSYTQAQTTATYGQTANATSMDSLPLVILLQLYPRHIFSLRFHSDRTTPVAWVFMGRRLDDFPDQERTRV